MSSKRPRHSAERPPRLAFADVKPILSRLERIADSVVLVGGQAVNFWAEIYAPRVPAIDREAPFTSKDIDSEIPFRDLRRNRAGGCALSTWAGSSAARTSPARVRSSYVTPDCLRE